MTGRAEYLRAAEIARLVGMSTRTARRWIADEIIPSVKLGRRARRLSGRRRSQFSSALQVSRRLRIPSTFSRQSSNPVRLPLSTSSRGRSSASTRRRVPAKSRVRPCRSGHRRLK